MARVKKREKQRRRRRTIWRSKPNANEKKNFIQKQQTSLKEEEDQNEKKKQKTKRAMKKTRVCVSNTPCLSLPRNKTSRKKWKSYARCAETQASRISRKTRKLAVISVKSATRRRMLWSSHQTRKLWRELCLASAENKDRCLFTAREEDGSVLVIECTIIRNSLPKRKGWWKRRERWESKRGNLRKWWTCTAKRWRNYSERNANSAWKGTWNLLLTATRTKKKERRDEERNARTSFERRVARFGLHC